VKKHKDLVCLSIFERQLDNGDDQLHKNSTYTIGADAKGANLILVGIAFGNALQSVPVLRPKRKPIVPVGDLLHNVAGLAAGAKLDFGYLCK
jgi:hypothetical protein